MINLRDFFWVKFTVILAAARAAGCLDCGWRSSARSFSGFVAVVSFGSPAAARAFAIGCARVLGVACFVRPVSFPAPDPGCAGGVCWQVSAPCIGSSCTVGFEYDIEDVLASYYCD